jgi:hypothetical protein
VLIAGRNVDDRLLKLAAERGRATGRVFSYEQLIHRIGDAPLDAESVKRAVDSFTPSRLPPQVGLKAAPTLQSALSFGWHAVEAEAPPPAAAAAVPEGFGRVIVETHGPVGTPDEEYVSAYWPQRDDGRLAPLKQKNTVYFGVTKFGAPDRVFGPIEVDKRGIPLVDEAAPPAAAVASRLLRLESQRTLRAMKLGQLSSPKTLRFDYVTGADTEVYRALSNETAERLTPLQRAQVSDLTSYGVLGNLAPAINQALRDQAKTYSAQRALLDGALERALTLPKGLRLFRGASLSAAELKPGARLVDPGYGFTSLEPSMALRFAKQGAQPGREPVVLVIDVDAPVRGLVTGNVGESEVLLPRDLPLVIQRVERRDGVSFVSVKTVAA